MSVAIPDSARVAWRSGHHVGANRPVQVVQVRRGYLQRKRNNDGHWTAVWTPTEDFTPMPGVRTTNIETSFDANGIKTATVDIGNVYMRELEGALGAYHRTERGWFSPMRAYRAPRLATHKRGVVANEWEGRLGEAAEIIIQQGYGTVAVREFSGLIDVVAGASTPSTMRITARDFGQLATDCHVFGWNVDPRLRDPIVFVDREWLRRRERSNDPNKRAEAKRHRKRSVVIDDVTDIARTALRWAGFPKSSLRIDKAGVRIGEPASFARGEYLIDLIRKVQDVTGFTFFIGAASVDFPQGRPTLRRSNVATRIMADYNLRLGPNRATWVARATPVELIRDTDLLTGFNWQHTDEPLAGIIRVRGKDRTADEGGRLLGGGSDRRVMAVYRPPWHRHERDARIIKHVIHTEPLYKSRHQCQVAARMIALQEALAGTTAQIEIPARPGLELDDLVTVVDPTTGIDGRALIASLQSSFTTSDRGEVEWKQTLGVGLIDTRDVHEVCRDLALELARPDDDPLLVTVGGFGGVG